MFRFMRTHHLKFLVGAPIIFLVLVNIDSPSTQRIMLAPQTSPYVEVGERFIVNIELTTDAPVNAVGGIIQFDPTRLEMTSLSRQNSVVTLWSEEPTYSNHDGRVHFSGGILHAPERPSRDVSHIFQIEMLALQSGDALVQVLDPQILAHDGFGTNIAGTSNAIHYSIRQKGTPSPDVNKDGVVSLGDVNTLYLQTYRTYDPMFDLNNDQSVGWADVRMLLRLL